MGELGVIFRFFPIPTLFYSEYTLGCSVVMDEVEDLVGARLWILMLEFIPWTMINN